MGVGVGALGVGWWVLEEMICLGPGVKWMLLLLLVAGLGGVRAGCGGWVELCVTLTLTLTPRARLVVGLWCHAMAVGMCACGCGTLEKARDFFRRVWVEVEDETKRKGDSCITRVRLLSFSDGKRPPPPLKPNTKQSALSSLLFSSSSSSFCCLGLFAAAAAAALLLGFTSSVCLFDYTSKTAHSTHPPTHP